MLFKIWYSNLLNVVSNFYPSVPPVILAAGGLIVINVLSSRFNANDKIQSYEILKSLIDIEYKYFVELAQMLGNESENKLNEEMVEMLLHIEKTELAKHNIDNIILFKSHVEKYANKDKKVKQYVENIKMIIADSLSQKIPLHPDYISKTVDVETFFKALNQFNVIQKTVFIENIKKYIERYGIESCAEWFDSSQNSNLMLPDELSDIIRNELKLRQDEYIKNTQSYESQNEFLHSLAFISRNIETKKKFECIQNVGKVELINSVCDAIKHHIN